MDLPDAAVMKHMQLMSGTLEDAAFAFTGKVLIQIQHDADDPVG
jgi:hypothetical protein